MEWARLRYTHSARSSFSLGCVTWESGWPGCGTWSGSHRVAGSVWSLFTFQTYYRRSSCGWRSTFDPFDLDLRFGGIRLGGARLGAYAAGSSMEPGCKMSSFVHRCGASDAHGRASSVVTCDRRWIRPPVRVVSEGAALSIRSLSSPPPPTSFGSRGSSTSACAAVGDVAGDRSSAVICSIVRGSASCMGTLLCVQLSRTACCCRGERESNSLTAASAWVDRPSGAGAGGADDAVYSGNLK